MDKILRSLAERLRIPDAEIITADEMSGWPEGTLQELISKGILVEIAHSKGITCTQCEENCYIEPDIRNIPGQDRAIGVFICTRNPDIGRVEIELDRLRQWRINRVKLNELGYQVQVGWIVPWDDADSEYFGLQEAVNLANDDSMSVKIMSRLLEDLEFPVRRMHKGRRCKVSISDFRKWLQYTRHGKITDKDIEKYHQGVDARTKNTQKKKLKL